MGCNSSKQEDIARDRTRARAFSSNVDIAGNKSVAVPGIEEEDGIEKDPNMIYAGSYTQDHMKQYDLLDSLVKHTTSNFIDIIAGETVLEILEEDAVRRRAHYEDILQDTLIQDTKPNIMADTSMADVSTLLSAPLRTEDVVLIQNCCELISSTIADMKIQDSRRVVLSFEELQEEEFPEVNVEN